jgi:hypothetical protein
VGSREPVATYVQDGLLRMRPGVKQSFGGGGVFEAERGKAVKL